MTGPAYFYGRQIQYNTIQSCGHNTFIHLFSLRVTHLVSVVWNAISKFVFETSL